MDMVYFDYAATTPLDKDCAEVYVKVSTEFFGNSNSLHDRGGQAADILENCRAELARLLGVRKQSLYFTSGGSEGNFLAIEALLSSEKKKGKHIIAGMAEHYSIHGTLRRLKELGYEITYLPYTSSGLIDPEVFQKSIQPETVLAIVQHVNSEIGTIQPIQEIGEICRNHNIFLHCDAVQSFGKINLSSIVPYVSSFSFSGHKIYGPKGIGGVYIDPFIDWKPFFPGTSHEKGFRPGTVNVPGIAAMTVAAQKIFERAQSDYDRFIQLRNSFITALEPILDRVKIYQAPINHQLPSILGMSVTGIEGQWIMLECNRLGFEISTGSACHVGMQSPAMITKALGLDRNEAKEFIRISFGQMTTEEDVKKLANGIVRIVENYPGSVVI
jgi:cysteine desulfurase